MSVLYLCGAGNPEGVRLALRINEREGSWDRIVLLDDDPAKRFRRILGVEIAGPFERLAEADAATDAVANLVARTTGARRLADRRIAAYGLPFATLIHPDVDRDGTSHAAGVTVYQRATLGANCFVDEGSVIFMGAIVGHGSRVGKGCVLAPNAVCNARDVLGEGIYVGSNAAILPDIHVGDWATIGACSMVSQDVPAGATVMGNPGKVLMLRGAEPLPRELRPPVPSPA